MCLQTTAEEEDKWGSVVRTDHQFFQEFVDDNENTKSLAEATPSVGATRSRLFYLAGTDVMGLREHFM